MRHFIFVDSSGYVASACSTPGLHVPVSSEFTVVEVPSAVTVIGGPAKQRLRALDLTWVDPRTVAQARTQKRFEIAQWRAAANYEPFTFAGKQIAAGPQAREDIAVVSQVVAIKGALPAGLDNEWAATDGTYVAIPNVAAWSDLVDALAAHIQAMRSHARDLQTQVGAAGTVAAVDVISWNPP